MGDLLDNLLKQTVIFDSLPKVASGHRVLLYTISDLS